MLRGRLAIAFFTLIVLLGVARAGEMPASRPASRPVLRFAGPPVMGVRLSESLASECVARLQDGAADEAIKRLRAALKSRRGMSLTQMNELRLGLAIVLLRSGEVKESRKLLLPLSRLKQPSELGRAAEVIHDIAVRRAAMHAREIRDLCNPQLWEAELSRSVADITTQVRHAHGEAGKAITQRRWALAAKALEKIDLLLARAEVIDADAARLGQRDLTLLHAGLLVAEVRQFKVVIPGMLKEVSQLGGLMTMRSDSRTKRRGYVPADAVNRYNAAVDEVAAASEVGERWVAAYERLVAEHVGLLKRDVTARLTRANLPAKRVIFGR